MNDDALEVLRARVRAPMSGDKVTTDKRLKAEILLMRSHTSIIEEKPGTLVFDGNYGRGVAEQKEATLLDSETKLPIRWQPYKSHLVAVHSAMCWAVLGISIG